jgi:drug/metabolite transporter (DMT)-like permease
MAASSANVRGIQCLLVATTCLAINDACNKHLAATLPVSEIVLLRAVISAAIVTAILAVRGELAGLRAILRPDIMLRSFAESWIGPFLIIAFAFMSQADVTSIYMVAPVFVALAGFGHFKEQFSWTILTASLLALVGAWLFISPGGGVLQLVALLPLAASACQVLREVISRTMGKKAEGGTPVSNRVILLSTALFSVVAAGILAVFFPWVTPVTAWQWPNINEWLFLTVASVLFYLGVAYTYDAYRGSDLSVVAPFRYWYLLVAIAAGYIGFGEIPGLRSVFGMAIIVIAGVIVLWHQYGRKSE